MTFDSVDNGYTPLLNSLLEVTLGIKLGKLNLRWLGQFSARKIQPSHYSKGLIVNHYRRTRLRQPLSSQMR
ncbi:MAG: hypothetical protein JOZ78_25205 [Chroococcidiopsidaceae cyanobacterium CP_BM_ER_R8_30]|nr:hypothetical protein [Chroococcidiopsidaceae cyanobacterium CP_BM_ER_R8_30]